MPSMATQSSAAAPTLPSDSTHGFFKTFPRELRDSIYDLLYQEVDDNVRGLHFRIRTICAKFRLVSRQFKLEYDERSDVDNHNQLEITDDVEFDLRFYGEVVGATIVPCPALATHATQLTLNLIACSNEYEENIDCSADGNIEWHKNWINQFLRSLPHLRQIYVRLHLVNPTCLNLALESCLHLQALPNVLELKIMGSQSFRTVSDSSGSVHCATWTEEHGLQKKHDMIEAYRARA